MVDKKFYEAAAIDGWIVIIYERQQRFKMDAAQEMVQGLLASYADVGEFWFRNFLRTAPLWLFLFAAAQHVLKNC